MSLCLSQVWQGAKENTGWSTFKYSTPMKSSVYFSMITTHLPKFFSPLDIFQLCKVSPHYLKITSVICLILLNFFHTISTISLQHPLPIQSIQNVPKWFMLSDNEGTSISLVWHSFILLFLQELSPVTKAYFAQTI